MLRQTFNWLSRCFHVSTDSGDCPGSTSCQVEVSTSQGQKVFKDDKEHFIEPRVNPFGGAERMDDLLKHSQE